jgi:CheY-like chemotaxis protein
LVADIYTIAFMNTSVEKKSHILIVDDILVNRLLVSEIISDLGYSYSEATNGREAIEALEKIKFDLILMDIEMPVMNGIETTHYIRDKMKWPLRAIPIIALTAHNPDLFFTDFRHVGFDALLTKPYTVEKFMQIVENFCKPKH